MKKDDTDDKCFVFEVVFKSSFQAILRVNLNRILGLVGLQTLSHHPSGNPGVCQSAASARPGMWRGQPQPGFCCLSISGHRSQN